jgi:hypothetical protein
MNTGVPSVAVEAVRVKLSTLWIFIMLNMLFADIFTFMNPGFHNGLIAGSALYVIGGGSTTLHYLFFATLEVGCSALIVWYAWTWANPEG